MKQKISFLFLLISYKIIIYLVSSRPLPDNTDISSFDKLLHVIEYIPLGVLWMKFLASLKIRKLCIFSFIFSFFYAISDEFHQLFVPGRLASVGDIIADTIGIIIGIYIISKWQK